MVKEREQSKLTMDDIARLANVSRTAVSVVLNNRKGTTRLGAATRKRIETILAETKYRPNPMGTALVTQRSMLIGVAIPEIEFSFVPQAIQGIEDLAEDRGYGVLMMTTRGIIAREEQVLRFMLERGVDGMILGPLTGPSDNLRQLLVARNTPVTYMFGPPANPLPNSRSVSVDGHKLGYLGMKHLLDRGHRHIAHISMSPSVYEGIAKACGECADESTVEQWDWTPSDPIEDLVERWQACSKRPTAVFFQGDQYACKFMHIAIRNGIKVPEELAILGTDDLQLAKEAVVPLTTVLQPKYEQGHEACRILFELMGGNDADSTVFPPELVVRQST